MQNNIIQLTSYAVIENFDHLFRERCSFPEINGSASCVENLKNLKMIFKMTFFWGSVSVFLVRGGRSLSELCQVHLTYIQLS